MPYDDPEPDDPHVLVGVALPADAEAVREMAVAFADEFAQMGLGREHILGLFRAPFYSGAHRAWRALGKETIGALVDESLRVWGGRRLAIQDAASEDEDDDKARLVDHNGLLKVLRR